MKYITTSVLLQFQFLYETAIDKSLPEEYFVKLYWGSFIPLNDKSVNVLEALDRFLL